MGEGNQQYPASVLKITCHRTSAAALGVARLAVLVLGALVEVPQTIHLVVVQRREAHGVEGGDGQDVVKIHHGSQYFAGLSAAHDFLACEPDHCNIQHGSQNKWQRRHFRELETIGGAGWVCVWRGGARNRRNRGTQSTKSLQQFCTCHTPFFFDAASSCEVALLRGLSAPRSLCESVCDGANRRVFVVTCHPSSACPSAPPEDAIVASSPPPPPPPLLLLPPSASPPRRLPEDGPFSPSFCMWSSFSSSRTPKTVDRVSLIVGKGTLLRVSPCLPCSIGEPYKSCRTGDGLIICKDEQTEQTERARRVS